jgi:hypothetical protein
MSARGAAKRARARQPESHAARVPQQPAFSKVEVKVAEPPRQSRQTWRLAIPIVLLAALLPFYFVSFTAPAAGTIHDDGLYLITAKAMAEGKGYHVLSLPGEPKQTKYPIGFPALIAVLWKIAPNFPGNLPFLKIVPVLSFLAWIGMGTYFARRWMGLAWEPTLWLALFCAGTHWAIFIGTNFMSDLLFGALVLAALHFLLSVEGSKNTLKTALIAGLFLSAAYLVRTAAIAFVVGGALALLRRKLKREALAFGAAASIAVIAWTIWQQSGPLYANPIEAYYTAQNYKDWNLLTANYSAIQKALVFVTNLFYVAVFPPQIVVSNSGWVAGWIAFAVGAAVWVIYWRGMRRTKQLWAAHLCFGIYVALLLLWAWPPDRFMTSFLPLFGAVVYKGMPRWSRNYYVAALPVAALFLSAWAIMQYTRASGIPWTTNDRQLNWTQLSELHQWINKNTEPNAVVMANFDPAVYLYTGRKAVRPYVLDNLGLFYGMPDSKEKRENEFGDVLVHDNVTHVMRSSMDYEERDLALWISRAQIYHALALDPVVANPGEYQIFKVRNVKDWRSKLSP